MAIYRNAILCLFWFLFIIKKFESCCTGKVTTMTVTGSTTGGTVWGSNPYTIDSDMDRAALHAGIVDNGLTGQITLTVLGNLASFTGTTSNGVTTSSYSSFCGVQITAGSSLSNDPCSITPFPPPPPAINCTALITGCNENTCTNGSYCSSCMANYGMNIISLTQQDCQTCSSAIPNCNQCIVTTACTSCVSGYYVITDLVSTPGQCDLCINKMPQCLTCSDGQTCLTCKKGYIVNLFGNLCECDISTSKLNFCQTCSSPTVCTSCTSNLYFLNSTDHLCYSCSDFDAVCLQCSNENICTSCQAGYSPKPNIDGTALCELCSVMISNCLTCTSPTICIDCDIQYGLSISNHCQACSELHSPACITCEDSSECLSCHPTYVLIDSACVQCNKQISKCNLCNLDFLNTVQCSQCQDGFYLSNNQCHSCLNLVNYCISCSSDTCSSCMSPYVLGPDGKCSQCIPGYYLIFNFCMNMPGCQKQIVSSNGTQICLSCASELNFILDKTKKQCVCDKGFKENYQKDNLMSCLPVCGDGIVSINYEQCDDQNTESKDGCDSNCKIEKDFKCTTNQPSKCVLHLNFNTITFNYVSRVLGQNKCILSFSIQPKHLALQKIDWSKLIKFNFPTTAVNPQNIKFTYSIDDGNLLVTVPYAQELQNSQLQTLVTFDPDIVVSIPKKFYLNNKLNGNNAPLVFQQELALQTHKNINIITFIMVILLLLQFYLGSYFHKMIGLETIQVIQSIYFVRMISRSSQTSILYSMNVIQYSASGYENAELFYGSLEELNKNSMGEMASEFKAINMKQFFLLNVNFMLIPVLLALFYYSVSLVRKYHSRNKYIQTQEQVQKDQYRDLRRSAQWIYDHFFFPYVMMFNLMIFFFTVEELTKQSQGSQQYEIFISQSFPVHMIMTFLNLAIYCYEIFFSLEEFKKYRMTQNQRQKIPLSIIEKMEHDENNPDRANYHPAYVMVYLVYYLLLSISMILSVLIEGFNYSLQLTICLSISYLILIWLWQPYHNSVNIHNHFLKVYYGTFVIFLVICYLFSKVNYLSNGLYVCLMYVIMVLVVLILIIGIVRIIIEKIYRKKLQNDNTILQWNMQTQNQIEKQNISQFSKLNQSKKMFLMQNNPFIFQNQLKEMTKNQDFDCNVGIFSRFQKQQKQNKLSKQQQDFLVNKIRQEIRQKRQNLILEQLIDSFAPNQNEQQQFENRQPKLSQMLIQQNFLEHPLNIEKRKNNLKQKKYSQLQDEKQDKKMLREIRKKLRAQFLALN